MMVSPLMNWNDAAEDFLNQVLQQTPRPVRDETESQLRGLSEAMAEDDGKNRVGVETVIAAWVRSTPETLRSDLPRQMERFVGLLARAGSERAIFEKFSGALSIFSSLARRVDGRRDKRYENTTCRTNFSSGIDNCLGPGPCRNPCQKRLRRGKWPEALLRSPWRRPAADLAAWGIGRRRDVQRHSAAAFQEQARDHGGFAGPRTHRGYRPSDQL